MDATGGGCLPKSKIRPLDNYADELAKLRAEVRELALEHPVPGIKA